MIPTEVSDLADLIWPNWRELSGNSRNDVLDAAWRIYNAGWRKPETEN